MKENNSRKDVLKRVTDALSNMEASVEYVELKAFPTLQASTNELPGGEYVIAAAIRYSKARLIDNIIFTVE
ncbi:hypothetical protein JCM19037_687 [Geomicrobium sp. JCM 19037]|nr:pantoate--beta-alanine ligase [Geomicrobium sp. JCM 19037]GAK02453.1 hypothetical protein JCM19037_687 [Geomicrobium sp. JCM 19037]